MSLFFLWVGFSPIQLGFGLQVKVEVLVLLGEVKSRVYISVLLHVGLGIFFSLYLFFLFFFLAGIVHKIHHILFTSFLWVLFTALFTRYCSWYNFTRYCSLLSYGSVHSTIHQNCSWHYSLDNVYGGIVHTC